MKLAVAEQLSDEAATLLRAGLVELEAHRAVAIARLDRIATMEDVPKNMRRTLGRAGNGLKNHLKTRDLVGAMRDGAGVPVMKERLPAMKGKAGAYAAGRRSRRRWPAWSGRGAGWLEPSPRNPDLGKHGTPGWRRPRT